jgi:hypothetical protein
MNTYWIRKDIKNPRFENATMSLVCEGVEAETPEQAIFSKFGHDVSEGGVHGLMIVTSSDHDNGYRYWTIKA